MSLVTRTAGESATVCQPTNESPTKVAEASWVPPSVHRWPIRGADDAAP